MIIAVNFMQRQVRDAIEDLNKQYRGVQPVYQGDYFQQRAFAQIDAMLVFIFKVFQDTQAESLLSYSKGIDIVTKDFQSMVSFITVCLLLLGAMWVFSLKEEKKKLALLYGNLLLIPLMILKSTHRITRGLRETLEYTTK